MHQPIVARRASGHPAQAASLYEESISVKVTRKIDSKWKYPLGIE